MATSGSEADYIALANVQIGEHKFNAAVQTLKNAEKKYGQDYALSRALGDLEISMQHDSQAISYYKQALASLDKYPGQVTDLSGTKSNINDIISSLQKVS